VAAAVTILILAAATLFVVVVLLCALLASTRPSALAAPPAPAQPSERATARRTRVVERFDRWGRPMRVTDWFELDVPTRRELGR
jgi:hypothetical protein